MIMMFKDAPFFSGRYVRKSSLTLKLEFGLVDSEVDFLIGDVHLASVSIYNCFSLQTGVVLAVWFKLEWLKS